MGELDNDNIGELLSAYADGELDEREREFVERRLAMDEAARRLLEDIRRTAGLVGSLPRHAAPASIADDVRSQLERSELLGEGSTPRVSAGGGGIRRFTATIVSMAAVVGLTVLGGWWLTRYPTGPGGAPGRHVATAPKEERPSARDEDEERVGGRGATSDVVARSSARERSSVEGRLEGGEGGEGGEERMPSETSVSVYGEAALPYGRGSDSEAALPYGRGSDSEAALPYGRGSDSEAALPYGRGSDSEAALPSGSRLGRFQSRGSVASDEIKSLQFSNESLQLKVALADVEKRDRAAANITEYLAKRQYVNLSAVEVEGGQSQDSARGAYYSGEAGVNFPPEAQRQILVQLPAEELDDLLGELADEACEPEEVELADGGEVVRGLGEVRERLLARGRGYGAAGIAQDADHVSVGPPPVATRRTGHPEQKEESGIAKDEGRKRDAEPADDFLDRLIGSVTGGAAGAEREMEQRRDEGTDDSDSASLESRRSLVERGALDAEAAGRSAGALEGRREEGTRDQGGEGEGGNLVTLVVQFMAAEEASGPKAEPAGRPVEAEEPIRKAKKTPIRREEPPRAHE